MSEMENVGQADENSDVVGDCVVCAATVTEEDEVRYQPGGSSRTGTIDRDGTFTMTERTTSNYHFVANALRSGHLDGFDTSREYALLCGVECVFKHADQLERARKTTSREVRAPLN